MPRDFERLAVRYRSPRAAVERLHDSNWPIGVGWISFANRGIRRHMSAPLVVLAVCLLLVYPHAVAWILPAYAGLLALNGRHWLALGVGVISLALLS